MKKPLFSEQKLPMLLASLSDPDATKAICTIRNAIFDGADGFLMHLSKMKQECINEESLGEVFNFTGDKPLYTMNYRSAGRPKTDEILIDELLMSVRAGASMIDMMGDMFSLAPRQLTFDKDAIRKQRQVIEQVHELGGEVLMSSHVFRYLNTEEVLRHTQELEARGADFIKIAMCVYSEEEALDAIKTTSVVCKALQVPFLHICMGQYGKLHRAIGPKLGSCFALCVQQYTEPGMKDKPLLRAEKVVLENIDYSLARNPMTGTLIDQKRDE